MTDEERHLWDRYCKDGDDAARESLVLRYESMVNFWVSRWEKLLNWVPRDDLRQSAFVGIIKAVDRFDPDRGTEFTTYGRYWIRDAIFGSSEVMRGIQRQLEERYRQYGRAHDTLAQRLGRKPTKQEVAEQGGWTLKEIDDAFIAMSVGFPDEYTEGDDGSTKGGWRGNPESSHGNPEARSSLVDDDLAALLSLPTTRRLGNPEARLSLVDVTNALATLDEPTRQVMLLSCWHDMSDEDIGKTLDLKPNYVKQIRFRGIKKIKKLCNWLDEKKK